MKAQAEGYTIVHHGGSERALFAKYGLDLNNVADQLGMFRFALGYNNNVCPLRDPTFVSEENKDGNVRFPLSMHMFDFILCRKRQIHTAEQDSYDQGRVLVFMLIALRKVVRC